MADYRIISSDSHIIEPPDVWTDRIEPKFRGREPRIVREGDWDWWVCEDKKLVSLQQGAQSGVRFDKPENLTRADLFEHNLPGGYIPEEHVKDMDLDGVDAGLLYPSCGLVMFTVPDGELLSAIFSAYNDWLAEFCSPFPKRLKGIAMINVDDVDSAVNELERCANMGLVGCMITAYQEGNSYGLPKFEPLWSAAEDLQIPVSLHAATNRPGSVSAQFAAETITLSNLANMDHWVRMSLADMTLNGVFERHPKLQVGAIEYELSWIYHFLDRLDYGYTQKAPTENMYRFKEDMIPSDYIRRNVFYGFQEDAKGIKDRHEIGVDALLWGSDYPHQESTFPKSKEILEEILADCTEEEKGKICGANTARVYRID